MAVLLVTTLIVAVVGVLQLTHLDGRFAEMVDYTGKAIQLTGDSRIELLAAIRSTKNAILADDRETATEFAEEARQALERSKAAAEQLRQIVGVNVNTPEGKSVAELERAFSEYEDIQKQTLRLAVAKSRRDGEKSLYIGLYRQAREFEEFAASLATGAPPTSPSTNSTEQQSARETAAKSAVGCFYDLLFHVARHLNATSEQDMRQMEPEIRERVIRLQEAMRRFSSTLSDAERLEAGTAIASFEGIRSLVNSAVQSSSANSDALAAGLTMKEGYTSSDRCSVLLAGARVALKDRQSEDRKQVESAASLARRIVITTACVGSVLSLILAVIAIRSITGPVAHGMKVFEGIAGGDLTQRMNLKSQDEIGRLGAASDQMAGVITGVVRRVREVSDSLGRSAGNLTGVSNDLLAQSQQMTSQSESVAAGTEQMSTNVATMAAAAEEMSVNVAGISSASEEVSVNVASIVQNADSTSRSVGSVAESIGRITASLEEVARNAKQGSQMTQQARDMAASATAAMRQLDQAASEITKVTEVIKSIALQTNLLALNATIEATSAGEAGKGFAVVAAEVKELASQSAHSAEEIARKIESVQSSTREAVKVIDNVAQFVGEVNDTAGRISEAVDGQTRTAGHIAAAVEEARHGVESIARSIAEVAKGATDVSRNTAEAASAATDVSRNASEAAKAAETISANIHGVSQASRHNSASAEKVTEAARMLAEIATQLERSVSRFKVEDSATNNA